MGDVTGVDHSKDSVAHARKKIEEEDAKEKTELKKALRYVEGDAMKLPFPDNSFDAAISAEFFEHIHDLRSLTKEIRRVLKPGGILVFETVTRTPLSYLVIKAACETMGTIPPGTHDHRLFITPEEATHLLKSEGMEVEQSNFAGLKPSIMTMFNALGLRFKLAKEAWKSALFTHTPDHKQSLVYMGVAQEPVPKDASKTQTTSSQSSSQQHQSSHQGTKKAHDSTEL